MIRIHPVVAVPLTAINGTNKTSGSTFIAREGGAPTGCCSEHCGIPLLRWLFPVIVLLAGLYPTMQANAHEIRPGLLDIKERDTGWFDVTWKVPVRGEQVLPVLPILPDSLELLGTSTVQNIPGAQIQCATYKSNGEPLTGKTIVIDGLSALQTDVLLAIEFNDGVRHSTILRPGSPKFTIPLKASKSEVAVSYWRMGVVHILEGIDHLLFVLALLLIVAGIGPLVKAVTAFTVAHSITLALATLGMVHVPSKPTEAIIAFSIMFLATEIIHKHDGRVVHHVQGALTSAAQAKVAGLCERYVREWLAYNAASNRTQRTGGRCLLTVCQESPWSSLTQRDPVVLPKASRSPSLAMSRAWR